MPEAKSSASISIFRLYLKRQRWRTPAWAFLFAGAFAAVIAAFEKSFTGDAERQMFAAAVADNTAFQAILGDPRAVETVGGFTAWRLSILVVFAALWGLLTSTSLLRGEEDAGRWETLISGALSRRASTRAVLVSIGSSLVILWIALIAGLVLMGMPLSASAFFAAAFFGSAAVFVGIGALTAQLFPTRRAAAAAGATMLGIGFGMRAAADGTRTLSWMRWLTPFGWYEEAHGYTGSRFAPLLLYLLATAALCGAALVVAGRRDLGAAYLAGKADRASRYWLLANPASTAIRQTIWTFVAWAVSVAFYAFLMGLLTRDMLDVLESATGFQRLLADFAGISIGIDGFIGLILAIAVLPVSLHAVFGLSSAREEESTGRLDVVFAQPLGRRSWLAQRIVVVVASTALIAAVAALLISLGASTRGVKVEAGTLALATANCLPAAAFFMGLTVLLFGTIPRIAIGAAGGLTIGLFLWQLIGSIAKLPAWILSISPFHHVNAVPAVPFNATGAAVLTLLGLAMTLVGIEAFARRDLAGE